MAKTKAGGATKLGRDSNPKYLGVKKYQGEKVKLGSVIVRQRGSKILAGKNVKTGRDNTLYAIKEGTVSFRTVRKHGYDRQMRMAKIVSVAESENKAKPKKIAKKTSKK